MIDFDKQEEIGLTKEFPKLIRLHRRGAEALKAFGARTVYEIGSGLGAFLIAARDVGLDAYGYDPDAKCREFAIEHGAQDFRYLTKEPEQMRTDAIYCVEVFEHLTDEQIDAILRKVDAELFYFSSIPKKSDLDEYWGHINIKSNEEWVEFFKGYGWKWARSVQDVTHWGMLFMKDRRG